MAKKTIGSIVKGKSGKSDYFKVKGNHTLQDGQFLNLENETSQIAFHKVCLEKNYITEEEADKRIDQTKNFWNMPIGDDKKPLKEIVRFQVTSSDKE